MKYRYSSTPRGQKLLDLLSSVNGGAVSYEVIIAVLWSEKPSPRTIGMVDSYMRHIRRETSLGVVCHSGIGWQLQPALDGARLANDRTESRKFN